MHVKSELIKKSLLAEMYDITVRWRHSQWQFGPGFDELEITVLLLFFFFCIPFPTVGSGTLCFGRVSIFLGALLLI